MFTSGSWLSASVFIIWYVAGVYAFEKTGYHSNEYIYLIKCIPLHGDLCVRWENVVNRSSYDGW